MAPAPTAVVPGETCNVVNEAGTGVGDGVGTGVGVGVRPPERDVPPPPPPQPLSRMLNRTNVTNIDLTFILSPTPTQGYPSKSFKKKIC
jgi:hypothetical protein